MTDQEVAEASSVIEGWLTWIPETDQPAAVVTIPGIEPHGAVLTPDRGSEVHDLISGVVSSVYDNRVPAIAFASLVSSRIVSGYVWPEAVAAFTQAERQAHHQLIAALRDGLDPHQIFTFVEEALQGP